MVFNPPINMPKSESTPPINHQKQTTYTEANDMHHSIDLKSSKFTNLRFYTAEFGSYLLAMSARIVQQSTKPPRTKLSLVSFCG